MACYNEVCDRRTALYVFIIKHAYLVGLEV